MIVGIRKTQEQFEKDVYKRLGEDYIILSPYPGSHGKVQMKHIKCGNIFEKNVHDIITRKSGCPYCYGNKPKLYNVEWVKTNTPFPYQYISGYINMSTKCTFYCNKCKTFFEQTPKRLINKKIYGCKCNNKKLSNEDFLELLGEECLNEYEVLESYINMDTKIRFRHKKCNIEFYITPYQFVYKHNKKYCSKCYYKKSKGEIKIAEYLSNNKISFIKEYIFPEIKNFRFDFYIPDLNIVIEYDGEQHFKPIDFFGGKKGLLELNFRDREKDKFCLNKGINLIRIPYYEYDNITNILDKFFKEKSSTTIEI